MTLKVPGHSCCPSRDRSIVSPETVCTTKREKEMGPVDFSSMEWSTIGILFSEQKETCFHGVPKGG